MKHTTRPNTHGLVRRTRDVGRRSLSALCAVLIAVTLLPSALAGPSAAAVPVPTAAPVGQGFNLNPSDLKFILQQIKIAEHHATTTTGSDPCRGLLGNGPNQIPAGPQAIELPWGLRTVDGTCNNLVAGKAKFGAADQTFPTRYGTDHREAEARPDIPGFPPGNGGTGNTTYAATGNVYDSRPRDVSNLIVDQTASNPAAVAASGADPASPPSGTLFIQNVAPDVGLSAPFNSWFTLFGQFFDHGLDLVNKGPSDTVFVPLAEDDPLFARTPPNQRFLVLTRATGSPGATTNQTATFVDQSQTYASHPSHQAFLREYAANAENQPVSTGKMLEGALADGTTGGLATWASVKEQSRTLLGIELDDMDALNSPLIATDPYGEFLRGPNGYPQLVRPNQPMLEGDPDNPVDASQAVRTKHAFLDDIAHTAAPRGPQGEVRTADDDTTAGGQPPAGRYDDELLAEHFVAGDGRINENIGLTAVHHVFHAEHNRLAGDPTPAAQEAPEGTRNIKDVLLREDPASVPDWQVSPGVWDGERIFQAAKFVTEMEYQHLAFEEFARKVQPMVNLFGEGGSGYDTQINPAIRAEFAHAVYRFGHSMLTETVARREAGGGDSSLSLIDAFLDPLDYDDAGSVSPEAAAGRIVRGMTRQTGNEIDEFVTDALRNNLLGLPLDLATINMVRARETGVKRLNHFRAAIHAESNNPALAPYSSWTDFGFALRNRDSLVNFIAAYGKHPTITGTRDERRAAVERLIVNDPIADPATPVDADAFMTSQGGWTNATTGLNDVDLWVGGLAEKPFVFGGLLGSTFNYIFELQMEDLQFGDRFYYLSRTAGLNLLTQLEGNSFAELIHRTTDVSGLPADSFSRPDYVFNVGTLMSGATSAIADDPETVDYNEGNRATEPGMHLTKSAPAGTFRYTGPAHVVANGTSGDDRIWTSEGDDTIRGGEGKDWMQGGDGVDNLIGGDDDDILNDTFGDDTLKGGDGDDALSSGQGFAGDLNQGGRGKDFIVGGNDGSESFAGPGDDFVFAGDGQDTVFGDDGDDWIEGGKGPFNLLQGDNGAPFQNDPNAPGHDVLDGDGGEQDFDSEGGDDIMLMGPGVQRAEGMLGFDWTTHKGDPEPGDSDMDFTGALPPSVEALRDRFDLVEGLSGWNEDDVLRGDSRVVDDIVAPGDQPIGEGHELNGAGIDRISGLQALLGSARSFSAGNIILGGNGNDTIEGRGGDDIIDGDKWLNVRLSVRTNPSDPSTETRTVDNVRALEADVFAGNLDPGNIVIVREILDGDGAGTDKAVFTNNRTAYTCSDADGPLETCPTTWTGDRLTITDPTGVDGTDTLTGIEELVFSDSVPPGTPTDVTAVRGNEAVQLSFTPPPNPVDGFEVRVFSGTSDTVIDTRTIDDPDAASFLFPNLVNGVPVSFEVRAINGFGPGEWSARSNVVTPAPGVPGRPDAPAAAAGNGQVSLSWAPPADNGGAVISQYAVRVRDADGNQVGDVRTTNGTSMVVNGLTNETAYSFAVRATNSAGNGPFSLDSLPVTPTARTAPAAPRVTTVTPGNARVSVTWAPGADGGSPLTGFSVRLLDSAGLQVGTVRNASGSARSMVITGLRNGTRVRAQVLARNDIGQSAWSTPSAWVTPATVPTAPRSVSATAGSRSATVRWVRPASTGGMPVLRYRIQVLNSAGRQVGALRIAGRTATQLRVTGLAAGRAYRLRVQAGNERGYSPWSARSNAIRPRR